MQSRKAEVVHVFFGPGWELLATRTSLLLIERILETVVRKEASYEICKANTEFSFTTKNVEELVITVKVNETGESARYSTTLTQPSASRFLVPSIVAFTVDKPGYVEKTLLPNEVVSFPEIQHGKRVSRHALFLSSEGDDLAKAFQSIVKSGNYN